MGQAIRKQARVIEVADQQIVVEVCRPSACAGCAARGLCHASGGEDGDGGGGGEAKRMTLLNDGQGYAVGQEITLVMRRSAGLRAVAIAYLAPVVLVVGLLLLGQYYGVNENLTAGVTLGAVVLYFIGLRLMRQRIGRSLSIEIEK